MKEWNDRLWQVSSLQDLEASCRDISWGGGKWEIDFFRFQWKGQEVFITPAFERSYDRVFDSNIYQFLRNNLKDYAGRKVQNRSCGHLVFGGFECVWAQQFGAVWRVDEVPENVKQQLQRELHWGHRLIEAEALIYQDDLTGLYNYRCLESMLETEMRRAARFETNFSLIFLDVDNFKEINDAHGHLVGSAVLKGVANALNGAVREVDSVFRYGGDEYVVLALGADGALGVRIAERVREAVASASFCVGDQVIRVTLSIGIASYPEHGRESRVLLDHADRAMYGSKHSGKNCVTRFMEEKHGTREKSSKELLG
ncbi:MAG: GGDEF domain-containing protein [Oligoflexales bacterium]